MSRITIPHWNNIRGKPDFAALYQPILVSGTSIRTINGQSLLGSGDIVISGGGSVAWADVTGKPTEFPPSAHNHTSASITDFAEAVDDEVATLLQAGTDVSVTYNDALNTLTIGLGANVPRLNAANTWTQTNTFSGTIIVGTGVSLFLNATGPTLETRAAGGLKVCNVDGSAVAPIDCSRIKLGSVAFTQTARLHVRGVLGEDLFRLTNSAGNDAFAIDNNTLTAKFWPGAASTPSIVAGAFSTSGLYWAAARVGVSVTGAEVVRFNSDLSTVFNGSVTASGLISCGTYTVATLPSAAANAGRLAQVTDSSVTTNGSAVAGGGSNRVLVFSTGSTWDVVVA